jgi:hypothetical protein
MYEIKPEYKRFVALAGADENLVNISNGSNLAKYPSVVFKVFIDGKEAAASPVMRVLSPAWRFDVELPESARMISLVAMDAGDGSREDATGPAPGSSSSDDRPVGLFSTAGAGQRDFLPIPTTEREGGDRGSAANPPRLLSALLNTWRGTKPLVQHRPEAQSNRARINE